MDSLSTQVSFIVKNNSLSYREYPLRMTELFTSIFATNPPSWADIQTPMNMMLRDKRRMVMDKARGEAHQLHLADPDAAPGANQSNQPGTQRWGNAHTRALQEMPLSWSAERRN